MTDEQKIEVEVPAPMGTEQAPDVEVDVPPLFADGHVLVVAYAGGEPITYEVADGKVEVSQKHLAEFLAVVAGAKPAS